MPIVAIVEFRIEPTRVDEARALFERILGQTRGFDGADRIDWLVDRSDHTAWTLYEEWASPEAEQAYRDWRMADGAIPEMGPLLAGPPRLTRYDTLPAAPG